MIRAFAAALIAWAVPAWAQPAPKLPCAAGDRPCFIKALRAHPVRGAAYWKASLSRPVAERLGPAPPELVEFLHLDNAANGFPEKPRASRLSADFLADVRGAIADLPPAVRRAFDATFAGVWFVDDLGGTGFTDMYLDGSGRPAGGFVVLDAAVLGRFKANGWATWKENTPFKPGGGWTLEARIEKAAGDDRRGAIRYILLHELGHVLSINRDVHPRWDLDPGDVPASARYPFFELSWTVDRKASRYDSKFDASFPARRSVTYYLGAKLGAADMAPAYEALARTNFPTLYAATSPGDDFAESFVSYVHTVLMRRPWEIVLRKDGKVAMTYRTCWEEPRCADKRRLLEGLLR
ncbi:MAG: hypothetical protein NDI88_03185 [Lysobacter sp.]|nr:hypothetical protein [Lysobacter sp.]